MSNNFQTTGESNNPEKTNKFNRSLNFNYSNTQKPASFTQKNPNVNVLQNNLPVSPRFDSSDAETLKNGPPLGAVLQQSPSKISMIGDSMFGQNFSEPPSITSLPKVPNVTAVSESKTIIKEDIRSLSEKANTLIQQLGGISSTETKKPEATLTAQQKQTVEYYNSQQNAQEQSEKQYQILQDLQAEQIRQQNAFLKREQDEREEKHARQDYGNPNIVYTMEQDAKIRADFRVKFGILREAYPKMNIPEPGGIVPIYLIYNEYQQYVKKIHVDSSVESNKTYLLILWLLIEIGGTKLFGLPFSGYTKAQLNYMNKYQMFLVELGEKTYNASGGSSWPVEFKLAGLAIFNAIIFVLIQYLVNTMGAAGSAAGDQIRQIVDKILNNDRGSDVLRRAEEATTENIPPPAQPAGNPLGGFNFGGMDLGSLIGNLAQNFTGQTQNTEQKPKQTRQKPTPYGRSGTAQVPT